MINGNFCSGEGGASVLWVIFTILVAVAAVFALVVYTYGLWCSVYALMGVVLTLNQGINLLDICIIVMSFASAIFSVMKMESLGMDIVTYLTTGRIKGGMKIIKEDFEASVLLLIFEFAKPKLLQGVVAKIESTKFFKVISKKWGGGKTINLPEIVKPSDLDYKPDVDDPNPDVDNPKSDPDENTKPDGNDYAEDEIWTEYEDLYGDEFVDNFKPFGEDG